jgi:hypothetical protein
VVGWRSVLSSRSASTAKKRGPTSNAWMPGRPAPGLQALILE